VDFVNFKRKIVIEVDGGQHTIGSTKDRKRDKWLREEGFEVLRFWDNDVLTPHPNPLPNTPSSTPPPNTPTYIPPPLRGRIKGGGHWRGRKKGGGVMGRGNKTKIFDNTCF